MTLDKWYLDAIFPDGTVWYGYRARIQPRFTPGIHFASGREIRFGSKGSEIVRWSAAPAPFFDNNRWHWQAPGGFEASWQPTNPAPFEMDLSAEQDLRIRWSCLAPAAIVTKSANRAGKADDSCGTGYVERLQLETTCPGLPFRALRWGHAKAGSSSLVWIHWAKGRDFSLVLENGIQVPASIETLPGGGMKIQTSSAKWETSSGCPICDRDFRHQFPRLLVWLFRRMVPSRELKIFGQVRCQSGPNEHIGSGIWEEVLWP